MSKLFVSEYEEENQSDSDALDLDPAKQQHQKEEKEDDDLVVEEIPIFMNQISDKRSEVCLLQYISQLASKPMTNSKGISIPRSRIKNQSNLLEIDIPLDTGRFFDQEKSNVWDEMNTETYGGSLMESPGNYVFCVKEDEANKKKSIILTPINKVAQIRPIFHHIDKINDHLTEQQPKSAPTNNANVNKESKVQVVQMTAKSGGSENEIRFSEAIQTFKKSQNEEFLDLNWIDESSERSKNYKKKLFGNGNDKINNELEMNQSKEKYYDELLNDQLVVK